MDLPQDEGDVDAGPSGYQRPLTDIAGDDVYFQVEIEGHENMNVSSSNPNYKNRTFRLEIFISFILLFFLFYELLVLVTF